MDNFQEIVGRLKGIGIHHIYLQNFNQDPLEKFFGSIRSLNFRNVNPNSTQFTSNYKTLLINNLSSVQSVGANCMDDSNVILLNNLKNFILTKSQHPNMQNDETIFEIGPSSPLKNITFPIQLQIEKGVSGYIAGFLTKKLKKIVKNCDNCKTDLFTEPDENIHNFTMAREYTTNNSLMYANTQFINNFIIINRFFNKIFCKFVKT